MDFIILQIYSRIFILIKIFQKESENDLPKHIHGKIGEACNILFKNKNKNNYYHYYETNNVFPPI